MNRYLITLDEFWAYEEEIENKSKQARIGMDLESHTIAEYNLEKKVNHLSYF
jgi:hypothetical protein